MSTDRRRRPVDPTASRGRILNDYTKDLHLNFFFFLLSIVPLGYIIGKTTALIIVYNREPLGVAFFFAFFFFLHSIVFYK